MSINGLYQLGDLMAELMLGGRIKSVEDQQLYAKLQGVS